MFSGVKSDFMMEAVPYFEGELLEMILNEDEILLQFEKESSHILISCRCNTSSFCCRRKDSICACLAPVRPVCPRMLIKPIDKMFSVFAIIEV